MIQVLLVCLFFYSIVKVCFLHPFFSCQQQRPAKTPFQYLIVTRFSPLEKEYTVFRSEVRDIHDVILMMVDKSK